MHMVGSVQAAGRRLGRVAALALAGTALAGAAAAADLTGLRPSVAPAVPLDDPTIITLSANVAAGPAFPGDKNLSLFGYPGISFRRASEPERFTTPDDGFSISLLSTPRVSMLGLNEPVVLFGPVVRYKQGRYSGDEGARFTGLRDVRWSLEPGAFLEIWPVEVLRMRFEARQAVNGHDGLVGNIGLDYVQPYERFTFSIGPRIALGDDKFTRAYFGVLPSEAALNPRVFAYRPQGGLTSVGGLASISYRFDEQWRVTGYAAYDRLQDDAERSPITRALGSADQYTVGLKVNYSFAYRGMSGLLDVLPSF